MHILVRCLFVCVCERGGGPWVLLRKMFEYLECGRIHLAKFYTLTKLLNTSVSV